MPLSVEEYQTGQLYALIQASRAETHGDTAVEILANEPFSNERGTGQYTHKVIHMGSKIPRIVAALLPASALVLVEKAWNAYPYCRTEYSNPFLGDRFSVTLETRHLPDKGDSENVHGLSKSELENRKVIYIDIAKEKAYDENYDPTKFVSPKTNRGPLNPLTWTDEADPVMCCYKLVTIKFQVFGLQGKVEDSIQRNQFDLMCKFHQSIFCLIEEWHGLSMLEVRVMEAQIKEELDDKIKTMKLPSKDPTADVPSSIKSTPF